MEPMNQPAPVSPRTLEAFRVEIRTPNGVEHRYLAAPDVVAASTRAVGQLAIDMPDAEVVGVQHIGPALTS